MTRKQRAQDLLDKTMELCLRPRKDDRQKLIAFILRESVEGFNIESNPDRELSIENHHFIRGQNWTKDSILRLANEVEKL